ncbi:MAG TPA: alpha/beta hydrolase, partial [Ilumatobacteraceae bacterium]
GRLGTIIDQFLTVGSARDDDEGGEVRTVDDTLNDDDYDEFGLLHENVAEWGFELDPAFRPARGAIEVAPGQRLSYIRWSSGGRGDDDVEEPELVLLHGGGQNAHTWDTFVLKLGRPTIAFDLPGHGRSSRRDDRDYGPWNNATAVAAALDRLVSSPVVLVGMSLGGATAIRLAATRPDLFRSVVIVDVTPQVNDATREMTTMERGSVALISGPPTYDSFEAMAEATIALSPNRPAAAVRRGVRHNAFRLPDGRWSWRYDLFGPRPEGSEEWADFATLWDDVSAITQPAMLVRGGLSKYVLDEDEAEMRRRLPSIHVEMVDGAGHAVQSDRPMELVELVESFAFAG